MAKKEKEEKSDLSFEDFLRKNGIKIEPAFHAAWKAAWEKGERPGTRKKRRDEQEQEDAD